MKIYPLLLLLCLSSCFSHEIKVEVNNQYSEELKDIEVATENFNHKHKSLKPGENISFVIPEDKYGSLILTAQDAQGKKLQEDIGIKEISMYKGSVIFYWRPSGELVSNIDLRRRMKCCFIPF